jgi:hypothetical protein
MPDYPCITVLGPIRTAGELGWGIALPAAEDSLWKECYPAASAGPETHPAPSSTRFFTERCSVLNGIHVKWYPYIEADIQFAISDP